MQKFVNLAAFILIFGVVPVTALPQNKTPSTQAAVARYVLPRAIQPTTASDIAEITYPDSSGVGTEPTGILLTEPYRFSSDGIHIWRDAAGVWIIYRRSSSPLALSGTVQPSVAAQLLSPSAASRSTPTSILSLDNTTIWADNQVRFIVTGEFVEFDVSIDDVRQPGTIHIGAKGQSPRHVPFRLENRTLPPPGQIDPMTRPPSAQPTDGQKSPLSSQPGLPAVGSGSGPGKRPGGR